MNIIDAHIHFSNIRSFHETAKEQSFVDYSKKGIINEFEEAGVVLGIGMGLTETYGMGFPDPKTSTPMGLDLESSLPNNIADLSGLIVGTEIELMSYSEGRFLDHLRHALVYCDHYDRLLFGTDWPLAPIKPYIKFIQQLIPKKYHEDVFYNNAVKVFPKIKNKL